MYAADSKFYQFTAGIISLVLAQRVYDSLQSGESKSHHEEVHSGHEAPVAAPVHEVPQTEAPPVVAVGEKTPAQPINIAAETVPLPPAPDRAPPDETVLPTAGIGGPPALHELVLPPAVGETVGVGNVSAFSDGANVWVVEAGLYPGSPGAVRAGGEWMRARQVTDFEPRGSGAPPLLMGISADAAWVLVQHHEVKQRSGGDGEAQVEALLLAVPGMRAAPSGCTLLATAADPAVDLTPAPRAAIGKVTMGAGEALIEVSGLHPAGAAVFRAALPAAGSGELPFVALETDAPAGGELVEWLVDQEKLAVRGAIVYQRLSDQHVLLLRAAQEHASLGNPRWLATCKRLGLPLPPIDPDAPPAYSEWRAVAAWDAAAPHRVIGFRGEHAWLTDPAKGHVSAYSAEGGEVFKLPLR